MNLRDEVKAKVDCRELIARFYKLGAKNGHNWMFHCNLPDHEDRKPSLRASREKWNCFGCGAGGSCFDFLICKDRLNFQESLHELADMYDVQRKMPRSFLNDFKAITDGIPSLQGRMDVLNDTLEAYDVIRFLAIERMPRHVMGKMRIHPVVLEPFPKTAMDAIKFWYGWKGKRHDAMAVQALESLCADYGIEVLKSDEEITAH